MPIKSVAYQGIVGSFSSMAAERLCGPVATALHTEHFREIFSHVAERRAEVGIVPLENALAGTVQENYDLLNEFDCRIVAEIYLPVSLHLLAIPSSNKDSERARISALREVVSHPKALEQCSFFFEKNPHLKQIVFSDTAGAAAYIKERGDSTCAAIASAKAAELLGLETIASDIQNHASNMTRFVAISRPDTILTHQLSTSGSTHAKCSVVLRLVHRPGTLCATLNALGTRGFNLTKIESRPISGQPFEYRFYIDVSAELDAPLLGAEVHRLLGTHTTELRILGAFPCAPESA